MSREPGRLLWLAFDAAARSHPDAVACIHGSTAISYSEMHAAARAAEARLRATIDCPGAVIALVALDPLTTLTWMFGALSAGASVAPVAADGPDRAAVLRILDPDATVTCAARGAHIEQRSMSRAARPENSTLPAGMIVGTAGTTGVPKVTVHSHTTLAHAVRRLQLFRLESLGRAGRPPADGCELTDHLLDAAAAPALGLRYATTLPLTTMAGVTVALQALLAGEALVLASIADAPALLEEIAAARVTNISLTPLLAQRVLRAATAPQPQPRHQLLLVGVGGGPVAPGVPAALEAALGCPVAVGYGTTETGGAITMGRVTDPPDVRHRTVGRALPGVDLSVDPQTHELAVRCASNAVGYLSRGRMLTELDRGARPTGDLARVRIDGAVELCGRADALILRGGRNIDPVRIESALEDHPAVRRAAAFGMRNRLVAGEQDIWSLVELDHAIGEGELRAHCNRTLGASLTPRRVIAVEALPLTADGAVRRDALARLTEPRSPDRARDNFDAGRHREASQ